MFMNHRVKKIVKTKFIHIKHIFFYRYNLHNYLNSSWRINDFADLVPLSSNLIEFHNFGNKAEGKHSSVIPPEQGI